MSLKTYQIVNGDVVLNQANGRPEQIVDTPKASQDVRRILNLDAPTGAGLNALMGRVFSGTAAFSARVQQNIRRAFNRIAQTQANNQRSARSPEERLVRIARMYVVPAQQGTQPSKTGYIVQVDALTAAGSRVTTAGTVYPAQGG